MNLIFNAPYAVDTFFFLSGFLVLLHAQSARPSAEVPVLEVLPAPVPPADSDVRGDDGHFLIFSPSRARAAVVPNRTTWGNCVETASRDRTSCGCGKYWGQSVVHPEFRSRRRRRNPVHGLGLVFSGRHAALLDRAHGRPGAAPSRSEGARAVGNAARGSIGTTFAIAYVYHLSPEIVFGLDPHATENGNTTARVDITEAIYDKPYCRASTYLIGMIAAYVENRHGARLRRMSSPPRRAGPSS